MSSFLRGNIRSSQITTNETTDETNPTSPKPARSTNDIALENVLLREKYEMLQIVLANHLQENKLLKASTKDAMRKTETLTLENRFMKTKLNELMTFNQIPTANENLVMEEKDNKIEIRSGTVEALTELLYNQNQSSLPQYIDTYLLTFRSFTTSDWVWSFLMDKYSLFLGDVNDYEFRRISVKIRNEQDGMTNQKMRLRILVILMKWLELYYSDFEGELMTKFQEFAADCSIDSEASLLRTVLRAVQKRIRGESMNKGQVFAEKPPEAILPKGTITLDELDPTEIARQLTLIEWNLFRRIAPKELLSLSWTKKDKEFRAPNVLKMIARFNEVSNWICVQILSELDIKKRANNIRKIILIGEELLKLRNYNGVFEITSGLLSAGVTRLKLTWEQVPKPAYKIYEKLKEVTDSEANFAKYREAVTVLPHQSCLPYLGRILSDIVFIEEGNPIFLENGHVNFIKCRMIGDVITQLRRYQQHPYNLQTVDTIVEFLTGHQLVSEDECFKMSLVIEPRMKKREVVTTMPAHIPPQYVQ